MTVCCIPNIDIGSRYSYLSAVMEENLEARLKGEFGKKVEVPKGVHQGAISFISSTLESFKNPSSQEGNYLENICIGRLVLDVMGETSWSGYKTMEDLKSGVKKILDLTKSLEETSKISEDVVDDYGKLKEFYSKLSEISEVAAYDRCFGHESKYTYVT